MLEPHLGASAYANHCASSRDSGRRGVERHPPRVVAARGDKRRHAAVTLTSGSSGTGRCPPTSTSPHRRSSSCTQASAGPGHWRAHTRARVTASRSPHIWARATYSTMQSWSSRSPTRMTTSARSRRAGAGRVTGTDHRSGPRLAGMTRGKRAGQCSEIRKERFRGLARTRRAPLKRAHPPSGRRPRGARREWLREAGSRSCPRSRTRRSRSSASRRSPLPASPAAGPGDLKVIAFRLGANWSHRPRARPVARTAPRSSRRTALPADTLAAAEAPGTVGPNLDQLQPSKAIVVRQVTNGEVHARLRLLPQGRKQIDAIAAHGRAPAGKK